MTTPSIHITRNIDEDQQLDSFQNATLHRNGQVAISIATHPKYADPSMTQEEITKSLFEELAGLAEKGWQFEVQMGNISEFDEYATHEMTPYLINKIQNNQDVKEAIAEGAKNTPQQPWGVICIHELVLATMNINLDTDDTDGFGTLLKHFNDEQNKLLAI